MKLILIILTFLIPVLVPSETDVICECFPLNSKSINGLKSRSDLIAIGKPVERIKGESDYEEDMVVFEIDSLIKGSRKIRTILINQNNAENCAEYFELCSDYLITGDEIKNAKSTYRIGQTKHSEKLEKLVGEYYTISTNGCRSFALKSNLAEQFLADKN